MQERCNILGVKISTVNLQQAIATLDSWITMHQSNYVCVTPVHSVMDCYHQPELKPIFNNSGMTTPDGMPIVWLLRAYGYKHVDRVYGPDLMRAVCQQSIEKGYRHFLYGGASGVPEKLTGILRKTYPGLNIVGTCSPPFRTLTLEEDNALVMQINATRPDIVWVGLGSPKQERWMAAHVGQIQGATLIGVGAAFDFLSGAKKQAPRWIQRSGFEWVFRLLSEPRRLGRRYLVNNPLFVLLITAQLLGVKSGEINRF